MARININLIGFIFIICSSFSAQSQIDTSTILGRWKECTKIEKSRKMHIDTGFTCESQWLYEFQPNGKYVQNYFVECEGKKYQEAGLWMIYGGELTLLPAGYCTGFTYEPNSLKMITINKNKWVLVGKESKKVWVYHYYIRVQ